MNLDDEIEWWTRKHRSQKGEAGTLAFGIATGLKLAKRHYGENKMSEQLMTFNNGLTPEHDDKLDDLQIALVRLRSEIEALGRHRTYSLAVTKIEEAEHWLRARKHAAP